MSDRTYSTYSTTLGLATPEYLTPPYLIHRSTFSPYSTDPNSSLDLE